MTNLLSVRFGHEDDFSDLVNIFGLEKEFRLTGECVRPVAKGESGSAGGEQRRNGSRHGSRMGRRDHQLTARVSQTQHQREEE